jgi:pyruvate dehydrogenase E2 component (dihydrolipoamide acetyltransferase)
VLAAVERGATRAAATVTSGPRSFLSRPDTPMQLSQMRKAIAKRMGQANAEIPHFYLTIAANMDNAVALREQLKQALPDVKISFNDIVVMAVAHALKKHPEVNAYWDGKTIVQKGDIHVGVAVALDDGLIVPVVRFAEQKSLSEIAVEIRDLGTRARDKKLGPKEITGSSFTVSNLGMFGIEAFSAVINPGEGAILAVGAITDDAVVEDGQVTVSKRMRMTLACDHRAMDGAVGANFLATLRAVLEQPLAMMA